MIPALFGREFGVLVRHDEVSKLRRLAIKGTSFSVCPFRDLGSTSSWVLDYISPLALRCFTGGTLTDMALRDPRANLSKICCTDGKCRRAMTEVRWMIIMKKTNKKLNTLLDHIGHVDQ